MATYYLGKLAPPAPVERLRKLPLSRDQLMLLMAAINLLFLGLDVYLAHLISGTIRPREWIPIIFGPIGGITLLVAGLIALRRRRVATILATLVLIASIAVGLLGGYYHLVRAVLPNAPLGQQITVDLLVWAPPLVGPLVFSLVGLWGVSAVWIEDPPDSGRLRLLGNRHLQLPYSKTRAYLLMVSLGILATVFSSVFDHARTGFENPWLWFPTVIGVFGVVVSAGLAIVERPSRGDVTFHVMAMVLLIVVGLVGSLLHVQVNLTADSTFVPERFLRGAPFLAPLLFSNMGVLGLLALLDPREQSA